MDKIKNPFSPGAGAPPPELVGREDVLQQAEILLGRVIERRPEKSMILTGLRGVGKTVLLNDIEGIAQSTGYRTVNIEAHEGKGLAVLLAPHLRRSLYELDRMAGAGFKVRRGLAVLKSFIGALKVTVGELELGIDIEPERGAADSGDLEVDLPELFSAVAEAAHERQTAVAILIDEIQYLGKSELSALIIAMHKMQQKQLPLVLIGAGLPILPGLAGESKSYAERLFSFPEIGPLSESESAKALQDPVLAAGEEFESAVLKKIYLITRGYPYFLQEWGYQTWNHAETSPISLQALDESSHQVRDRLDKNFFRVRFDRLTPREKQFLRGMAELGDGPYRTSDIADVLKAKHSTISPVRAELITKGMIYSPAHGELAFTAPLFAEFMRRAIPDFQTAGDGDL